MLQKLNCSMYSSLNQMKLFDIEINTDLSLSDELFGYKLQPSPSINSYDVVKNTNRQLDSTHRRVDWAGSHCENAVLNNPSNVSQNIKLISDFTNSATSHQATDPGDILDEIFLDQCSANVAGDNTHDVTFGSTCAEMFQLSPAIKKNLKAVTPCEEPEIQCCETATECEAKNCDKVKEKSSNATDTSKTVSRLPKERNSELNVEVNSASQTTSPVLRLMKITTVFPVHIKPIPRKQNTFVYKLQETIEWVPVAPRLLRPHSLGDARSRDLISRRISGRRRTDQIRKALDKLWHRIPSLTSNEQTRRPNNLDILRGALSYIKELRCLLGLPEIPESLLKGRFGFKGSLWRSYLAHKTRCMDTSETGRTDIQMVESTLLSESDEDTPHNPDAENPNRAPGSTDILHLAMMQTVLSNDSRGEIDFQNC